MLQRQAPRPHSHGWIHVRTKREVIEVMRGVVHGPEFTITI